MRVCAHGLWMAVAGWLNGDERWATRFAGRGVCSMTYVCVVCPSAETAKNDAVCVIIALLFLCVACLLHRVLALHVIYCLRCPVRYICWGGLL